MEQAVSSNKPLSNKVVTKEDLVVIAAQVNEIASKVETKRPEKWKHSAVSILTDKKVRVNATTRSAYQRLVFAVCAATERTNSALYKQARTFAERNGLEWKTA